MDILRAIINLFRFDKTNWKAVTLCLVAATVFWFFNALNKEHTATISFPIDFKYDRATFIPVNTLPEKVQLNITGSGWDLLRKSLGYRTSPLVIGLDRPTETMKIPPTTVLALAATQLGQTKINHVATDTLQLSLEPRKTKKVKLVVTPSQMRFELGFGPSSAVSISPDSVIVEGSSSAITQLPDSLLLPFPQARNTNNVNLELEIVSPHEGIVVQPKNARVRFDVSELTDIKVNAKIIVLPATPFRHQISKDEIGISLRLPANRAKEVSDAKGLFAVIDIRAVEPGTTKVLPAIKGLPPFSEVLEADSVIVRKY